MKRNMHLSLLIPVFFMTVSCSNSFEAIKLTGASDVQSLIDKKEINFAEVLKVLQAKCITCHNSSGAASFANFDFATEEQFFSSSWFKAGDLNSKAIIRMKGSGSNSATMPAGSLDWSTAEFELIRDWIVNKTVPPVTIPTSTAGPQYDARFTCSTSTKPVPSTIRRLTREYYINSLKDFMSKLSSADLETATNSIASKLDLWPEDADPVFSKRDIRLSQNHVDYTFEVAFSLANTLVTNTSMANGMVSVCGVGSTKATLANTTCLQTFINYYGRKVFRRPLTETETNSFMTFYKSFSGDDRIVALLTRFLNHPQFFYRLDNEGTLLSGTQGTDAIYQLTKYELLAKMTFLFWAAPPDDALYSLVAGLDFKIESAQGQVLEQILSSPKASLGIRNFYYEWLTLRRTASFDNTSAAFASFASSANLPTDGALYRKQMIDEVLDFTQFYTLTANGRYEDLMTSPYSFARQSELSALYEVSPWNGSANNLVRFPASHNRAGLLNHAAFLSANSEYSRPVIKGKFVRVQLLCDEIPPPPPNLNIQPLVQEAHLTTSEVVSKATADVSCMACHSQMNPLGFASESFDSLGRFRGFEQKFDVNGNIVNRLAVQTGVSPVVFPDDRTVVSNSSELGIHIAATGKGQQCMVKQFFRYSRDRSEDLTSDGCELEQMRTRLVENGGSILMMLKQSVKQSSFTSRAVK